MKIEIPRQIRAEDFAEDEQELINKLSRNLTPFMDSVFRALDGGVDYENLNRQLLDVDILIDASGLVTNAPQIKSKLRGRVRGINVLNAINLINPAIYPTATPFISFTTNADIVTILNVTSLQPNSQYRLSIELIA